MARNTSDNNRLMTGYICISNRFFHKISQIYKKRIIFKLFVFYGIGKRHWKHYVIFYAVFAFILLSDTQRRNSLDRLSTLIWYVCKYGITQYFWRNRRAISRKIISGGYLKCWIKHACALSDKPYILNTVMVGSEFLDRRY